MAQRIIGLDIGSWSIKAMVLESSLRKMSFVDLREHHIPVDAHGMPLPGELTAAIKAVMARLDVDILTAGVPGVQVLMRELSLPFSDEKRVAPILGFQLESLLPRPLETMVYDWHVLRKTPEGAQLLCPAADKQWLDQWLGEVRAGGAEPRHLTLSSLAMGNLVPHLDLSEAGDRPIAIIDLGHRATQVTLLRNGQVEAIRALSRGGHQVTAALARSLELAYADAEHVKHHELDLTGAVPEGVTPAEHARRMKIAGTALEPILRELKMTIDAMMTQRLKAAATADAATGAAATNAANAASGNATVLTPAAGAASGLGAVILCGGMSRLPGMAALIERVLDVPVLEARLKGPIWEPLASGAVAGGAAAGAVGAVGIGGHAAVGGHAAALTDVALPAAALALEHMRDSDPHRVNLRRGDMAAVSDYGALRARAGWIAAFVAVLLIIFFVRKVMRISTLEEQEQALAKRLDEYGDKVLGGKPDAAADIKSRFETVLDEVTSPPGSETDEVYPAMTAFKIFYEVSRIQKQLNDDADHAASSKGGPDDDGGDEDELGLPKAPAPGGGAAAGPDGAGGATADAAAPAAVDKKQVELNSFAADLKAANQAQATLAGSAFDIVTVEAFATQLRSQPCFKKVERQDTKKTSNPNHPNWTDFTIKIDVKCDAPPGTPRADAGGDKPKAAASGTAGDKADKADKPEGD